jgi:hypothetical protein
MRQPLDIMRGPCAEMRTARGHAELRLSGGPSFFASYEHIFLLLYPDMFIVKT